MSQTPITSNEEQLRAEVAELRRQLEELRGPRQRRMAGTLALAAAALIVAGFFAGYLPHQRRQSVLVAEAKAESQALPRVTAAPVTRAAANSQLVLPGNMQPVTEAPILARADGYIKKRYSDIGDRVAAGQLMAEIEAPELDQQIRQARAALDQAQAAQEQAGAGLRQGQANEELARVTSVRWDNLARRGAVSRQENDTYQAQYQAQQANVAALEKAVGAARSNVAAAQANLARLLELKSYQQVRAPFAGVVTVRNVDTGALINAGSTLMFRLAQSGVMRTFVNVAQADAPSVHPGQAARLAIPDLPGRVFPGKVTRTANSLDPNSRTLLVEVQVPNNDGTLLPGMYAQVDLNQARRDPPLLIPGDALVVRPEGTEVAVAGRGGAVHFEKIALGRDYGDRIEVLSGVREGQLVIVNPGDAVQEGARVQVQVGQAHGPSGK